ncbi:YjgN family protein [Glacieibacterium frigidum]|uniref:DUF898 domain-containing protein n=1 Tax=Glacieibacterium frigidum TaxID=2593303 RepID=A0A552U7V9_9SPHN|nr:DUF898 family protein [Glacieibacterium frigidum]TRW14306.1 DUF898 domain-containing protein [Glacieibacterium frigidum]
MDTTAAATPEPIGWAGRIGDFIPLAIVNLLLTIVTLGIYRFWAKTRVRRFLWERTSFMGEPLEYRGRGIEKFIGALIVFAVLIVPLVGFSLFAGAAIARGDIGTVILLYTVLYFGLLYLLGVGLYRAQRYMFSRTAWRGIRGGMAHGGWRYGLLYLGMLLLQIVTLGFASPYVSTRLWNAQMNDASFGSAAVVADAEWRPIYGKFLFAWLGALVIYILTFVFMFMSFRSELGMFVPGAPPPTDPTAAFGFILKLYGLLIGAAILISLLLLSYHAALVRELFGKTRIATLGLHFDATTGDFLKFFLGNIAIVVLTLGLGYIVLPFRVWGFYASHLSTVGTLDVDLLMQTSLAGPMQGDGLADAFDASSF